MSDCVLEIADLTLRYPGGAIGAAGVDLAVAPGSFVSLFGPSGSGKTSILQMAGLLQSPDSGTIVLDGERVEGLGEGAAAEVRRTKLGFVFQTPALLPLLSAAENVDVALRLTGVSLREARTAIDAALAAVGMGGRTDHRPDEMSGGEQQRVAIARALVHKPTLLLADEPTGELDSGTGATVLAMLRSIAQEGTTVLMASHDPAALHYVDHGFYVQDGRLFEPDRTALQEWLTSGVPIGEASSLPD